MVRPVMASSGKQKFFQVNIREQWTVRTVVAEKHWSRIVLYIHALVLVLFDVASALS